MDWLNSMSLDDVDAYRRQGFAGPVSVMSTTAARTLRDEIEALEREHTQAVGGRTLAQYFRVNGHIVIPLLARIASMPTILDSVSSVLGPDLLVWSAELFIKEAGTEKIVSWHQDLTYWGMGETDEEVTAWLALTDVSVKAGCMRFVPGSHRLGILAHDDTFGGDNLLSRGQCLRDVDEREAVPCPLRPGQMSLHHGRVFHASGANRSTDRRIGVAIRYVTPDVRKGLSERDYAMLVRGQDRCQGWINIAAPARLFEPQALALYDQVLSEQEATLAAGAEGVVSFYGAGEQRVN